MLIIEISLIRHRGMLINPLKRTLDVRSELLGAATAAQLQHLHACVWWMYASTAMIKIIVPKKCNYYLLSEIFFPCPKVNLWH